MVEIRGFIAAGLVQRLRQDSQRDVWKIGGANVQQQFVDAGVWTGLRYT